MIELIKLLNETKGEYLAAYIICFLLISSILMNGIVKIFYVIFKNQKKTKESDNK